MRTAKSISVLFLGCLLATTAVVAGCAEDEDPVSSERAALGPKPTLDTPTLSIVDATQTTITVRVCGGATTGAPAGFSLHWTTEADYILNGWSGVEVCSASFSGVPSGSRFNLDPGECTDVVVGALDDSEIGVSFTCNAPLECGTEYAFRTFAHGNSTYNRSEFSDAIFGTTAPCDDGCTLTQGFWKNHPDVWPVSSLTLGAVSYTQAQLLSILGQPVAGNGLISLAHQLIAAKLNVASGANPSAISSTIAAADALIHTLVVPPIGGGFLLPASTSALTSALDAWNNGITGPGHCE